MPFVHDSGTGITHRLNEVEQGELRLTRASAKIDAAMPEVQADSAAALKDEVVSSLVAIKQAKPSEYQRKRAALKHANGKVSLAALDQRREGVGSGKEYSPDPPWLRQGTAGGVDRRHLEAGGLSQRSVRRRARIPVCGSAYLWGPWSSMWPSCTTARTTAVGAPTTRPSPSMQYHWPKISQFFAAAPIGIACPGGFYQLVGDRITLVPLTPEHRQRVMLTITPSQQPIPQFEAFLHDTFASEAAGEEEQQIALVQEIAGAIMLGLMPRHQKAVLFYEPFGRAGKGTLERILRNLVPENFVTAVSPFRWSHDYHVATLAGSRLNVVGELPENEAIPASSFKSVIGGDLVTGRHPTHRPITFTNEAAHLFMSNHLITTKDQSEAFYARWLVVDFPNSRLRSGLPIDPGLAERIITNELPGIAHWALEGAKRLIANGDFSESTAHERLMAKWRRSTSSLAEFIHECCELRADCQVRRSEFYSSYTHWCSESGRKPFSKSRVKELLEHNIGMGVRLVEVNGYEVFRGLKLKPTGTGERKAAIKADSPDSRASDITNLDDPDPAF